MPSKDVCCGTDVAAVPFGGCRAAKSTSVVLATVFRKMSTLDLMSLPFPLFTAVMSKFPVRAFLLLQIVNQVIRDVVKRMGRDMVLGNGIESCVLFLEDDYVVFCGKKLSYDNFRLYTLDRIYLKSVAIRTSESVLPKLTCMDVSFSSLLGDYSEFLPLVKADRVGIPFLDRNLSMSEAILGKDFSDAKRISMTNGCPDLELRDLPGGCTEFVWYYYITRPSDLELYDMTYLVLSAQWSLRLPTLECQFFFQRPVCDRLEDALFNFGFRYISCNSEIEFEVYAMAFGF